MKKPNLFYCSNCIIPSTRPGISFDIKGICSACTNSRIKKRVDWKRRKLELLKVLNKHKKININNDYNCIVPVSGGKDSVYQTYLLKKVYKMRPLAITWKTPARTLQGEKNLNALRGIGVDHLDFSVNPKILNIIRKKSFINFGDSSYLDHLCIYNLIPNLAVKFKIPLVVWGENPYFEYGGSKKDSSERTQNLKMIKKHNILKDFTSEKWICENITKKDIASLSTPNEKKLKHLRYEPIYLGYYLPWDIKKNFSIAKKAGFKSRESGPIMGLYKESDIDCTNIVIHHYFKWLKFGFNRVTDNASNEIRKSRMSRTQAIKLANKLDGMKPPKEYISNFCKQINISETFFWKVANKFRNKKIWKMNNKKQWYIENWLGGTKKLDKFPHTKLSKKEKNILINLF
jgi:N-acetyl sugar amidotransferase